MFECLPFLPLSSIAHTRIADSTPLAKLGEHNKKIVSFLDGIVKRSKEGFLLVSPFLIACLLSPLLRRVRVMSNFSAASAKEGNIIPCH